MELDGKSRVAIEGICSGQKSDVSDDKLRRFGFLSLQPIPLPQIPAPGGNGKAVGGDSHDDKSSREGGVNRMVAAVADADSGSALPVICERTAVVMS